MVNKNRPKAGSLPYLSPQVNSHNRLGKFNPYFSKEESIDSDIVLRYRNNRCGILTGTMIDNPQTSLYSFCQQILGYDLAAFFQRQSKEIKEQINVVLETLLRAE